MFPGIARKICFHGDRAGYRAASYSLFSAFGIGTTAVVAVFAFKAPSSAGTSFPDKTIKIMMSDKQIVSAHSCANYTLLGLQIYAILYFCGCMFLPVMQKLVCPYYAATGRYCILCGYTRMTIRWLKNEGSVNFALAYFLICFGIQLLLRIINIFPSRLKSSRYVIFDLILYGVMWGVSILLFYVAHKLDCR